MPQHYFGYMLMDIAGTMADFEFGAMVFGYNIDAKDEMIKVIAYEIDSNVRKILEKDKN